MSQTTQEPVTTKPEKKANTGMNKEIKIPIIDSLFNGGDKPKTFSTKESIKFYKGIASMIKAQINTGDALKYYAEGLPNKVMANALIQIRDDINSGIDIYNAFKRSNRFDDMTLGLIKAGMESGNLDSAFRDLAERAQVNAFFKKKVRKIVLIPSIIFPVLIIAFIYSQAKIVPKVRKMVDSPNYEPKGPVKALFDLSDFTIQWWPIIVGILASIVFAFLISSKLRRTAMNLFMSKWRLLRQLVMGLRQVTFLGVIKLLHSNGITMGKAIQTSATSVKGTELYDELLTAADKYEKSGVPLAIAFTKYTSVDDQVIHMMAIGEKSASMGEQLDMLVALYKEDCEQYMEDFANILNFFVMLGAVSMVALVFLSVFMPIFLGAPEMMKSGM